MTFCLGTLVRLMVILCVVAGTACKKPTAPKSKPVQTFRFPVDVTLTRGNLGWEHFTPRDYYNPAVSSRLEIWVTAQYNKSGFSPGMYCWLRTTFADSTGYFSNIFQPYDYTYARYDSLDCPAPVAGEDTSVMAYLGTIEAVHNLIGGPGSGYSIAIWLAAAIPDAVSNAACIADTSVAADDTVHISEIVYQVLPLW